MPAESPRARVFFALWLDATGAASLHRLAIDAHARFGGRVMRADTLHLTLAFVGDIERSRIPALVEAGTQVAVPRFDVIIDTLGEWPRKNIVWAGPGAHAPLLVRLHEDLSDRVEEAGFSLQRRVFVPHVTLLRKAACSAQRSPLAQAVTLSAENFVLVESQRLPGGASYKVLTRWTLQ